VKGLESDTVCLQGKKRRTAMTGGLHWFFLMILCSGYYYMNAQESEMQKVARKSHWWLQSADHQWPFHGHKV
jgi:hypothetical protein